MQKASFSDEYQRSTNAAAALPVLAMAFRDSELVSLTSPNEPDCIPLDLRISSRKPSLSRQQLIRNRKYHQRLELLVMRTKNVYLRSLSRLIDSNKSWPAFQSETYPEQIEKKKRKKSAEILTGDRSDQISKQKRYYLRCKLDQKNFLQERNFLLQLNEEIQQFVLLQQADVASATCVHSAKNESTSNTSHSIYETKLGPCNRFDCICPRSDACKQIACLECSRNE